MHIHKVFQAIGILAPPVHLSDAFVGVREFAFELAGEINLDHAQRMHRFINAPDFGFIRPRRVAHCLAPISRFTRAQYPSVAGLLAPRGPPFQTRAWTSGEAPGA